MLKYAKIRDRDIANGPGVRVSIFFQGCLHQCQGCFNPETWNPKMGFELTKEKIDKILDLCGKEYINGISLLGGDPFYVFDKRNNNMKPERDLFLYLITTFKKRYPEKNIWIWTGYSIEDCLTGCGFINNNDLYPVLNNSDVLIDGHFIEKYKIPNLKYRGSTNQRIIDLPATLSTYKSNKDHNVNILYSIKIIDINS